MASGPGGGGKSLELMQRRLLSGSAQGGEVSAGPQQQQVTSQPQQQIPMQQPQVQPQQINQNPRPGKSAASLMATQAREQAAAQTVPNIQPQPQQVAPSRPKGKDFAAMAMSVGAAKAKGTSQPVSGAVSSQPAQPVVVAAPPRPKGKDFSAMANRMGAPPQPPVQQPVHQAITPPVTQASRVNHQPVHNQANIAMEERAKLRAQQMQAAARAAAGLPPLVKPTATSVTTVPPPITPSKTNRSNSNSAPAQPPVVQEVRPQPVQRKASTGRTSSGATGRGRYNAATRPPQKTVEAPVVQVQVKTTIQPTPQEGRLSLTAMKPSSAGAHSAPLVGQRIQDLVKSVDPNFTIDAEAEEQVLQLADDFLDKVVNQSLRLANHRGSKSLDVQDLQMVLAKHWGIVVPGLGLPSIRPAKPGKQTASKTAGNSNAGGIGTQGNKRKGSDSSNSGTKKRPNTLTPVPS